MTESEFNWIKMGFNTLRIIKNLTFLTLSIKIKDNIPLYNWQHIADITFLTLNMYLYKYT